MEEHQIWCFMAFEKKQLLLNAIPRLGTSKNFHYFLFLNLQYAHMFRYLTVKLFYRSMKQSPLLNIVLLTFGSTSFVDISLDQFK